MAVPLDVAVAVAVLANLDVVVPANLDAVADATAVVQIIVTAYVVEIAGLIANQPLKTNSSF